MPNHCRDCHTHAPLETGGFEIVKPAPSCPGCPECERLRDVVRHAEYWEAVRKEERDAAVAEAERLRAELLSVRESFQRERAGQVRCNAGHISDRALWDCPVCVEAVRGRLAKAQGVIELVQGARYLALLGVVDEQVKKWEELDDAMAAWERENG